MRLFRVGGLLPFLGLAVSMAACSADSEDSSAIDSLDDPALSTEFDAAFWNDQAVDDTETWHRAVELCRDNAEQEHPNCTVVLSTAFIQGLEKATDRPFPEYGTDTGSTGAPQSLQESSEEESKDRSSDKASEG